MRKLDIPLTNYSAGDFWWFGMDTNQWLCNPPNVKGWPGYHSWLNSAILPKRNNDFAKQLILDKEIPGQLINPHNGFTFDWIPFTDLDVTMWAFQFPDYAGDILNFATQLAEHLCAIVPDVAAVSKIVDSSGIIHRYEWGSLDDSLKVLPIRRMLYSIIELPHFQLC